MLQIDQLHLRLPSFPEEEVKQMVQDIGQRLAEELPQSPREVHLGALQLRLDIPHGATRGYIVSQIVESILAQVA